ncbi:MAG: hypothetical protein AAGE84_06885 [Cyanobacteria bacterium P01_G01_bin.39]
MSEIFNIFPFELLLLTVILIIIPTIVVGALRYSLYHYLINSAHKVSRLLIQGSRGKQPEIVSKLEARFRQASAKLEQVNTIALIDGLYGQEELNFLGISLRCEQWDYFCRTLPNLLLAFGLLGTFIGISFNLYNLSQTISQSGTNADDLNYLVSQLQVPLQNMGIAFFSSLIAIACSSILIAINLRCNTNFAKSLLISSLEDYLDNIFKINVQGDTRLDKAVDRMVRQQQEFLERFHLKVGQVIESTIGNAANKMVTANQGFQNNVDSMVSQFNDITHTMATSTNSFRESAHNLQQDIQTVSQIVPKFVTSANKIESASELYLEGAEKIEASKFSEHLESLTADLARTQTSFTNSTTSLENQVIKIGEIQQQTTELAQQVYTQLDTASEKLENSSISFHAAAEIFKASDFADKLTTATNELITIPEQFNKSTASLHSSTDALKIAVDNLNTSSEKTTNLIEDVNKLNQKSSDLLEQSDRHIQEQITSFNNIQSELETVVETLSQHKAQINTSISNFGEKVLTSFREQTENNTIELQKLTSGINNNLESLQDTKNETVKLITILENYQNNFNNINSSLSNLANTSAQQGKQLNSNLNGIGITSDRLLNSFEQRSQNNIKEIQNLTTELKQLIGRIDNVPSTIKELLSEFQKHEQQMNANINNLNNNISNQANQQINTYNQQIQQLTDKFNKIL